MSLDMLFERLKRYDEVTLLELLDLTSEDILERCKDIVMRKKAYLLREMEMLPENVEDDLVDELDGFEIRTFDDYDREDV